MRFLFVKTELAWPRVSGHDVHSYHMMRALLDLGHDVGLLTAIDPSPEAIAGLNLCHRGVMDTTATEGNSQDLGLSWAQERFRSYWGIEQSQICTVKEEARRIGADVVVAVGLEVLPYLAGVSSSQRVWYAADEWVWHHLSSLKLKDRSSWGHLRSAVVKGLYERAYSSVVDRAWTVSDADRRAMKLIANVGAVDVVPNGVDAEYFQPSDGPEDEYSCVFWGRLDFTPNVQALAWFCRNVWPRVLEKKPQAQFRILGHSPIAAVEQLAQINGVSITANLPDLRPTIRRQQVVVLPFRSGGGIKNKLLEAASMAKPIICSKRACNGLNLAAQHPFVVATSARSWADALGQLWSDARRRKALGADARTWVTQNHTWASAAERAVMGLESSLRASAS